MRSRTDDLRYLDLINEAIRRDFDRTTARVHECSDSHRRRPRDILLNINQASHLFVKGANEYPIGVFVPDDA
ncbi:hypothetical protein D2E76_16305 [Mycobacteroides abscessus]|uniref:Uncharacterized protein n=1 Tax=Mycobacteroides abscessus TaxID=36809 RepID=A0ABD7HLZ7_9MYCO|nr:hypothetical protein D2E76_16305 [Mycobacteroides abscessus]